MNIVIHVGPPKSGTSAIQKWLLSNIERLNNNGFYYPSHESDPNGISSGNVLSIFSRDTEDKLVFDKHRYTDLVIEAKRQNCHTVVFSSEFFFQQIQILAEQIPQAKFIAYLRFPAEVIESAYNQGVKRHQEVKAFGIDKNPKYFQVHVLFREVKAVGIERFQLRPYHPRCFVGGEIVSDFLAAIGWDLVTNKLKVSSERVNTSYSLEALEFKRWFNQYNVKELQEKLDYFLQNYQGPTANYSLIPSEIFEIYRNTHLQILNDVGNFFRIVNLDKFIEACRQQKQRPFARQVLPDEEFLKIATEFLAAYAEMAPAVFKTLKERDAPDGTYKSPHRIKLILGLIPVKFKFRFWFCHIVKRFKKSTIKGVVRSVNK